MAKLIPPPQINHLNELIDVLVHQDKYLQYMKDLHAMRDAIVGLLGVVDTQEKADALLASAEMQYREATDTLTVAHEEAAKLKAELDVQQAHVTESRSTLAGERQALDQARAEQQHDFAQREADLSQAQQQASAQAVALRQREALLAARMKDLDEREAKLNKLKQALGDAGI